MGKGQSPTPNELKFIYNMLSEGYADTDILAKYDELERHGKLGIIPYHKDIRFIRQRRKEYDALKTVLKKPLEQEANPTLQKARNEHISEIRNLIQEFKEQIRTPRIEEISVDFRGKIIFLFTKHEYRFRTLFDCLKEHLPNPAFWEAYSLWMNNIADYFDICKNFVENIMMEDEKILNCLEENTKWEPKVVIKPILMCISDKAVGKEPELLVNLPKDPDYEELTPYLQITSKSGTSKFVERKSATEHTERIMIDSVIYVDPTICVDYLNHPETSHIIELFNKLKNLEDYIQQYLDEFLIRRDYIEHICKLCPGQHEVSS